VEHARPARLTLAAFVATVVIAVVVAACTGSPPSVDTARPSSPPTPALTPVPVVTLVPPSTAPLEPEPEPTLPGGPPAAVLLGIGRAVPGDLGSFSWSAGGVDFGSDSPWLPGEDGGTFPADAPVSVRFEPALRVGEWRLLAAPAGGEGERATVLASGSGGPIDATLSLAEGAWELQLDVRLGSAGDERGTGWPSYFWRVTIAG